MMLECNLELFSQELFLTNPNKRTHISLYETRIHRVAQGLQGTHLALPSVSWSEPENQIIYIFPVT